jgi:Cu(I)/Ag(I) efflux system membrane fusion protein/cobalt-zinc-cadmium efflux system membrane fusion protein
MKRIIRISVVIIGFLGLIIAWQELGFRVAISFDQPGNHSLLVSETQAAQKELKAGMIDPKTGKKIKYWKAPMDPTYIRNEPGKSPMGMDMVPVYEEEGEEKEPASTISIDPVTMQNMGVRMGRVKRKTLIKYIRTLGNITYDETKIFTVNTKFNGWIENLYVNFVGQDVKKGQPLFDIYSPELVTRIRDGAERLLKASLTRMRYWNLTEEQIEQIGKTGKTQKVITIYSPATGIVFKKKAFKGHYVKKGEHQYEIVDLSTIWVDVDVYEYELPWIRRGMAADMELAYIPGKRFKGRVLFIYPFLEAKTRTAKLRLPKAA